MAVFLAPRKSLLEVASTTIAHSVVETEYISACDRELWPVTLTVELDLGGVTIN